MIITTPWTTFVEEQTVDAISGSEKIPTRDGYTTPIDLRSFIGLAMPFTTIGVVGSGATYECDGIADNVQIQQAIDAVYAAGGGRIILLPGTYTLAAIVNIKSNVVFEGLGYSSYIIQSANYALKISGHNNIVIRGIRTDASAMTAGNYYSIYMENCQNILVENNWINDANGFAVFVAAGGTNITKNIWILKNRISGRGTSDVVGGGPAVPTATVSHVFVKDNIIIQNAALGNGHKNAIDFTQTLYVQFNNNICEGSIIFGSEQVPYKFSSISDNIVSTPNGATDCAIGIIINPLLSDSGEGIIIANNTIDGGFLDLFHNPNTPLFKNVVISGNTVRALAANVSGGAGLRTNNLDGAVITGNVIYESDTHGIWLHDNINSVVANNIVRDSATYGIFEDGVSDNNIYTDNILLGNASGAVSLVGVNNVVKNNVGLNPDKTYAYGNKTGATALDAANGSKLTLTATGNLTLTIANGLVAGQTIIIEITQDATGGRTISKPSNVLLVGGAWSPTATGNAKDRWMLEWDGSSKWREIPNARSLNIAVS